MDTSDRSGSPGMPLGCAGFSSKATTRPAVSTSSTPNCEASRRGTGRAATVTSAPVSWWKVSIWFRSIR